MYLAGGFGEMNAAADFLGPGALETPRYDSEILDMVRRRGVLGQRIMAVPATGQPSRYFEQTTIVPGAFQDPRAMTFQPTMHPTRRERAIQIKALYAAVTFGLLDVEVTRQQGQFSLLVAKDIQDAVTGVLRTSDIGIWNGSDTDLALATTLEYVGGLTQINRTASVASSASIIDALKAEVASLMAQTTFDVRPTAIYVNPVLGDKIDQEERNNQRQIPQTVLNTVTGGLLVNAIATQAGLLPIIPDWALPNGTAGASSSESGKTDYKAVILTESLVERHYISSPNPRVFVLGLEGDLATRYAIVQFGQGKCCTVARHGRIQFGFVRTYSVDRHQVVHDVQSLLRRTFPWPIFVVTDCTPRSHPRCPVSMASPTRPYSPRSVHSS
jgi:hypothetical protein